MNQINIAKNLTLYVQIKILIDSIFVKNKRWHNSGFVKHHFLVAFRHRHIANPALGNDVVFGDAQVAQGAHVKHDSTGDGLRRVVADEGHDLYFVCHESCQHDLFLRHLKVTTVALDDERRRHLAQLCLLFCISFNVVQNADRHGASLGRVFLVEVKDLRDFGRCSWISVFAKGDVDGRRLDAVAVHAAKHLLLRNLLVLDEGVVNDFLGDAGHATHVGNVLKLVPQCLFAVGHRHPLDTLVDFAHLVTAPHGAHDFARRRRLLQQGVGRVATPRRVVARRAVLLPKGIPFRRIVQHRAAYGLAPLARGEAVVHRQE